MKECQPPERMACCDSGHIMAQAAAAFAGLFAEHAVHLAVMHNAPAALDTIRACLAEYDRDALNETETGEESDGSRT